VPIVYLPFRAEAPAAVTLVVRGSGGSAHVVSAARAEVSKIDPDLALGAVRTLGELRAHSRAEAAGIATQLTRIGLLALLFSGVGLYAMMAYAVRRRTQEVAVRLALGARSSDVRRLFLKTGGRLVAGGLALGVPASLWMGRLLRNSIVRFDSNEPLMILAMVFVLALVALVACVVPARRAASVEPAAALRLE
jgi:putative ABC transport system permease protein